MVAGQTAASAADSDSQLQEIVVTANKREESLNHVGVTVAAISGNTLQERQISTLQDLTANVPSLTFANSPSGTPVISLRGVGFMKSRSPPIRRSALTSIR